LYNQKPYHPYVVGAFLAALMAFPAAAKQATSPSSQSPKTPSPKTLALTAEQKYLPLEVDRFPFQDLPDGSRITRGTIQSSQVSFTLTCPTGIRLTLDLPFRAKQNNGAVFHGQMRLEHRNASTIISIKSGKEDKWPQTKLNWAGNNQIKIGQYIFVLPRTDAAFGREMLGKACLPKAAGGDLYAAGLANWTFNMMSQFHCLNCPPPVAPKATRKPAASNVPKK
jgi:hypothetical protein